MIRKFICTLIATIAFTSLFGLSLSQKREQLEKTSSPSGSRKELRSIQDGLAQQRTELHQAYEAIQREIFTDPSHEPVIDQQCIERIEPLRKQIYAIQQEIAALEGEWKNVAEEPSEEFEGLWHQPDTTIGQLVIDYSSGDSVFAMPPEIAGLKIHLSSRVTVPKSSWNEMLEIVLANFGIGIRSVSPFVKQLYFFRLNQSGIHTITDDRTILSLVPPEKKVAFICSPPAGDVRRIVQFLEKFAPVDQLNVQAIGGHLVLVGLTREVADLMKVYDFIASPQRAQAHKIVTLKRGDSEEIAKILNSMFEEGDLQHSEGAGPPGPHMGMQDASFGFRVFPMKIPTSSLFIIGKKEQIERANHIIEEIETSIGEVQQKGVHWYSCKHSEAAELAKVLSQVYVKMVSVIPGLNPGEPSKSSSRPSLTEFLKEGIQAREHAEDSLMVESPQVSLSPMKKESDQPISDNFIVDQKTNSVIMVVENSVYPQLKELLIKLDVPKRMVQIDVLLFEKKVTDTSSMGLSSLKLGDAAPNKSKGGGTWSDSLISASASSSKKHKKKHKDGKADLGGILEFFLSGHAHGSWPAYALAYQFLLTQEDIQINANPSITTVNQTPAKIAVVDQMSINTGAVEYDEYVKDSYSRAEYGTTIQITPTVHAKIDENGDNEPKFITLTTDIIFDSTHPDPKHDRPNVTRRNIKNEVRVQDGETVILGGLRRKLSDNDNKMIPFLGEIPGVGKLFSMDRHNDSNTEMFIFITPRILPDDHEQWKQIRLEELMKRPGDTPEFLTEVLEAKKTQKKGIMERSLRMLVGKPDSSS